MKEEVCGYGPQGWGTYEMEGTDWSSLRFIGERQNQKAGHVISPGLVDLHIHGAFGIDFMTASQQEMIELAESLPGYELFLPTTVTAPLEEVERAISNLPQHRKIGGFHLEGPFISPKHPGAQPPEAIINYVEHSEEWQGVLTDPRLKLITLAPEQDDIQMLIRELNGRGVIVSMGHTDADFNEAISGIEMGVSHVTHTFNAMRGFHHREAGAVGATLLDDRIYAELIFDGKHVSQAAAQLLFRMKGPDRVIAVSDSTLASGLKPGTEITMWRHDCIVGEDEVRLKSNGALAGSAVTLDQIFKNIATTFGYELAIRSCSLNPRNELGINTEPTIWNLWDGYGVHLSTFDTQN
ncbi:MAG: hypothetical protein R2688_07740 [Fimbriimonadaceae bacterium]